MRALEYKTFEIFSKKIMSELKTGEALTLTLSAESTHFTRLSQGKIRQSTNVKQASVDFTLINNRKNLNFNLPYTGNEEDFSLVANKLAEARKWMEVIPEDPYLVHPKFYGITKDEQPSNLLESAEMLEEVLELSLSLGLEVDLAGIFSSGDIVRATSNSAGQFHWFKTKNFCLDYSLYNEKQKAVKSLYAGNNWSKIELQRNLQEAQYNLSMMNRPSKKVARGDYRVYLSPSAVSGLVGILSWGGVSMGAHQKGNGSFKDFWQKKKRLSPKLTLVEDFSLGLAPRFNEVGEVSSNQLTLIDRGQFANFFISTRTANEYKLETNFANDGESMRSPTILQGDLERDEILKKLGTGVFISDLHYLNWSDRETARITGMTRYACFWVENGEIISPIEDLRFDESFYSIFGDALESVTNFSEIIPETSSYVQRSTGGSRVPGLLLSQFKFTL